MRHSESVTITENVPELGYLLIATHEGHVQLIEDCDPDEINDILDGKPITAEFVRGFLEVASMMLDGSPEDLKIYAPFDRGIDTDEWVKSIDSGAEFNGGWLIGKVLYQIVPTVVW